MAAPRKYSEELRERATRMALEARQDPAGSHGAIARIAGQLGVHKEALRNWVRQAEVDGGVRPGTTTGDSTRIAEIEREVRELRRANTILKQGGCRTNPGRSRVSWGCLCGGSEESLRGLQLRSCRS